MLLRSLIQKQMILRFLNLQQLQLHMLLRIRGAAHHPFATATHSVRVSRPNRPTPSSPRCARPHPFSPPPTPSLISPPVPVWNTAIWRRVPTVQLGYAVSPTTSADSPKVLVLVCRRELTPFSSSQNPQFLRAARSPMAALSPLSVRPNLKPTASALPSVVISSTTKEIALHNATA